MKNYVVILILILIFGCNNSRYKKQNAFLDLKNSTIKILPDLFYNDDLVLHERNDFLIIAHPAAIESNKFCGVFFGRQFSINDFEIEYNEIKNSFFEIFPDQNDCILYIPYNSMNEIFCDRIILPVLSDTMIVSKDYNNDSNYSYFIRSYNEGIYLNNDYSQYFSAFNNDYHGYSIGVAVSEQERRIIYWLIIL